MPLIALASSLVLGIGGAAPAAAAADPAGAAVSIGAAALYTAGGAVTVAMSSSVQDGMVALGRAAATFQPPAKVAPAAPPAPQAHSQWSWQGWQSGASGKPADLAAIEAKRGPLGIVGVWCDTDASSQTYLYCVNSYDDYNGAMDVAVGGLVDGETWDQAASGALVDRWTTSVRNLRAKRQGKGITYIRFAHEMNGTWFTWSVTKANVAAYVQAYRLYASIVRREFPEARLTWSPNFDNRSDATIDDMYPGADVVDVIGPDVYDGWPPVTSADIWAEESVSTKSPPTWPRGVIAWQRWARSKGKPIAVPEWGLTNGDHPIYIKGMHDVMAQNAASHGNALNAGRFVYDIYYHCEDKARLFPGPNTQSGAMYASLRWGN